MKNMKTSLAIAVALATGVGTSAFAQVKQDIITFNLTGSMQTSVSQTTGNNVGNWVNTADSGNPQPKYYKTGTAKFTQKNILQYIAYVLHGNANYFSSKANLVLVEGELSGFFGITPDLGESVSSTDYTGYIYSYDDDSNTQIANSQDSTFVTLANGRHYQVNPDGLALSSPEALYPVGHMQPWGQIYVQDPGAAGYSAADPLCENVTYFFALSVEECYDCFYMNSFISTATFKTIQNKGSGPVCCNAGSTLQGAGKDSYYLTISFDNTINNPFLYPDSTSYAGVTGIHATASKGFAGDAIVPDALPYVSSIDSALLKDLPYEARFTLNGILTYTWKLGFISKSDLSPDFLGTGSYAANGYGFIGLFCTLLTGTATFTERAVNTACCDGTENDYSAWYGWWYGVGAEYAAADTDSGYDTVYNIDVAAGEAFPTIDDGTVPFNVAASLTYHYNFDLPYPSSEVFPSGWPTPSVVIPSSEASYDLEPFVF